MHTFERIQLKRKKNFFRHFSSGFSLILKMQLFISLTCKTRCECVCVLVVRWDDLSEGKLIIFLTPFPHHGDKKIEESEYKKKKKRQMSEWDDEWQVGNEEEGKGQKN